MRYTAPLLHGLAVQRDVETLALDVDGDAQANDEVDDLEDDQRDDGVISDDDGDALDLVEHLGGIALDEAGGSAVLLDREHAGEDRARGAADAVDAEAVERVVIAEHVLETGGSPIARDAGDGADRQRAGGSDEAQSRRDGDEAGDGTGADAD